MISLKKKTMKILMAVAICTLYLFTQETLFYTGSSKVKLQIKQKFVRETEYREMWSSNRVYKRRKNETKILNDALLNIEREGKFPEDDPCPYLGVRKPIRGEMYPNDYYDITCKPHRPDVRHCELAYEIYGSASEHSPRQCSETKYESLCKISADKSAAGFSLECDWSTCFPRKPYIGEMSPSYGKIVRWEYSPSDAKIEEIIHRSMENGFNFVFLQCGSLKQVLVLPRKLWLSSRRKQVNKKININIVVIDSVSRPHFYRSMPRTIEAFRQVVYDDSIPATVLDFELLQSISQHTTDNCKPLYSGVTTDTNQQFNSTKRKLGKSLGIPVLFGEYKKSGYQTLFQEEGCWYDRYGLTLTDMEKYKTPSHMRDFSKRWKELNNRWKRYYIDDYGLTHFGCEVLDKYGMTNDFDKPEQVCLNGDFISTYFLQYHLDYLRAIRKRKDSLPILHYLHLETGHTSSGTRIHNDDLGLADYVKHLARDPNTLTIFLSDHGHTRTDFAKTVEGRFELSNPLMFVILPEDVAAILGEDKVHSLVENQRRLFTTLDIHQMLMSLNNPVKMKSKDFKVHGILSMLPRNRTCETLPLTPLTRCKCEGWDQKVEDNSPKHVWLAEFAIGQLNNMIQDQFIKANKKRYGSCVRLRGLQTRNNAERQAGKRLEVTMDLLVESALPDVVEVFQVLIETPSIPDETVVSAQLMKFERHTLYNRYQKCVDDGVELKLCTCLPRDSDEAPMMTSDALRNLATRSVFGVETKSELVDENRRCLLLLRRKHNSSISYEIANLCDNAFNFEFSGTAFNVLLTAKLPINIVVKPRTIYFLLAAIRFVVNDSYFDIKTNCEEVEN
ncbi:uncharacterized protein LOC114539557 isoform X2 [Dendronephthya gigantea]|uniref:uncharacterized protein LOC114539557 isoform X2 n=1 Tax=Dendronephthya gigantea TaxID=151771 RepID=UPI00106C6973|nr:uncharacterized protein LOC114539557 isoform X2 [Dendronephthya gigantea]